MKNKITILGMLLIITSCSAQEEPIEHIIRKSRCLMDRNDVERALEGGTWVLESGMKYQFSYDTIKGKWKKSIHYDNSGAIRRIVEESYEIRENIWGSGMHWFKDTIEDVLPAVTEIVKKDNNTIEQYIRVPDINDPNPNPDPTIFFLNFIRSCQLSGDEPDPYIWKREW